jgi:adenosylcobinamide-phosphate synthase
MMEIIILTALAVIIDLALGDPPNALHPVAWMGKVISLLEKAGLRFKPAGQFIYGIIITLFTTALFAVPTYYVIFYVWRFNIIAGIVIAALLLKSTFAITGLRRAAQRIRDLLKEENLDKTRFEIRALVSRDTSKLSKPQLASAAVESVAEGLCDSLVAPVFFFLLLGVPGAVGYRVINTFDAMIGYHGKYEHLGKFAARLDDVLNYIPARISLLLLVMAAAFKKSGRRAWQTARREHIRTESPNAGWTIAAMAGALNTRLEKTGHYIFRENGTAPSTGTIDNAVRIFLTASFIWVVICLLEEVIRFAVTA